MVILSVVTNNEFFFSCDKQSVSLLKKNDVLEQVYISLPVSNFQFIIPRLRIFPPSKLVTLTLHLHHPPYWNDSCPRDKQCDFTQPFLEQLITS